MGRIVIVVYRPKKGKDEKLLEALKDHLPILRGQGLATAREPIVMRSRNGDYVEVFEWKSREAIDEAHSNPVVQELWKRFEEVCDFEIPVNVPECNTLFSEFESVEVDRSK